MEEITKKRKREREKSNINEINFRIIYKTLIYRVSLLKLIIKLRVGRHSRNLCVGEFENGHVYKYIET